MRNLGTLIVVLAMLGLLAVLGLLPAGAAAAACPAPPSVDAFVRTTPGGDGDAWPAGTPYRLSVVATDEERLEVAWGDGATEVDGRRHTYARPGTYAIDVVAVRVCDGRPVRSAPGRLTQEIGPACVQGRAPTIGLTPCDRARGALRLRGGGRTTGAVWRTAPCRDNFSTGPIEPERPPTAQAASCAAPAEPPPVPGAARARLGGSITVRLGAGADRVTVRAGTPSGPTTGRLRVRRVAGTRRLFRVRIPRDAPAATRLFVRADGEAWVAGLRLR